MHTMKRTFTLLLTLLSVFIAAIGTGCSNPESSGQSESSGSYTITSRKMQYHVMAPSPYTSGEVDVYFMNGSDVSYLEVEDWVTIQKNPLLVFTTSGYDLTLSKEGDILKVTHSKYLRSSHASGIDYHDELVEQFGEGRARAQIFGLLDEYSAVRSKYYPDGVPGYEEIGDTAFITFDEFQFAKRNYYQDPPTAEDTDNVALISTAVQQIIRPDSPIKNVVLDLSCNTGGEADGAVYTLAAFLGTAPVSVEAPISGALATNDYVCDTNFDKKFDETDTLAGKGLNLYCLESGVSFSCGNLIPAVFKEDPHVALLGQRSSGGACTICYLSTALGSLLRLSSSMRLSYMRNGSFYDIDQGVEHDIFLSKPESFYNRQSLVEYIDSIR